ncbi:MAG: arginine--tRNA ligase [Candidatus Curtissbacteria bacterium]|nr:arginine--tRNA ligase [Candidatus Curtissbacteria bacterium]
MLRDQIKKDIEKVIGQLGYWGGGKEVPKNLTIQKPNNPIEVTRTSDPKFGDFTTNIALKIATNDKRLTINGKGNKQSPLEVAKDLTDSLKGLPYVKRLEVAGPGFINFFIKDEIWQKEVEKVLELKSKYGSNNIGKAKKARVEFVSANPTGPLHFGNARGGPIGDVLAAVLEFSGYKALREFYANDIGGQVQKLGQSVLNVAKGQKLEDQEYKGEYIVELAKKIGNKLNADEVGTKAVDLVLAQIEEDCRDMGIKFDIIYSESQFIADGKTKEVLETLEKRKVLKKNEGAVWFAPHLRHPLRSKSFEDLEGSGGQASDEFLKDRETVVIKSDGSYTYFANDIAYHGLKFGEGYDLVIDIFGANHHGHVPRLRAVIAALGFEEEKFKVVMYQWVRFKSKGKILGMSKRSGNFITAKEILEMVGVDALRFFILMHDASTHIDFDLDLAREKSAKNPVYYVQYAHARICSILSKSEAGSAARFPRPTSSLQSNLEIESQNSSDAAGARRGSPTRVTRSIDYGLLTTDYELALIKQISKLPELVEDIAGNFAVHGLTTYAIGLADSFHKFYENCQVLTEDEKLTSARLGLVIATKIALTNTLKLLGVSAPEKM